MIDKNLIDEVARHEEAFWSDIFSKELAKKDKYKKNFSSYWWELYFTEIRKYVEELLGNYKTPRILEAGSGSGKASILLGNKYDRTLLDISPSALKFAEHLIEKFNVNNITTTEGNIFYIPFEDSTFDFTWNIGVVEHYQEEYVQEIFKEMIRVTRENGAVSIGVPNFNSLPIIKAQFLKNPLFKFIPGYRLESEISYSEKEIINIFNTASVSLGRTVKSYEVKYFGSPLFIETPKPILDFSKKFLERFFYRNKFLIFITFRL